VFERVGKHQAKVLSAVVSHSCGRHAWTISWNSYK